MKKFLCLLFSAVMLLSLLTACGGETTDTEKEEKSSLDNLQFEGYNFRFRSAYMGAYIVMDSKDRTVLDDYKQARFDAAAAKYNCTIEPIAYGSQSQLANYLIQKAAAGGDMETEFNYDIRMETLYNAGVVIDLYTLDNVGLDFTDTDKWGTEGERLGHMAPDGALYCLSNSNYWFGISSTNGVVLVNDELIEKLGAVSPQEYLEKGSWTFSGFKEILPTYYMDEGEGNITYGLMLYHCGSPFLAYTALVANGVDEFVTKVDGVNTFNLGSSEAIAALQWASEIAAMKDYVKEATSHADRTFSDGQATLYLTASVRGTYTSSDYEIQNNLDDFSWMCFPYGPAVDYGTSYSSWDTIDVNGTGVGIISGDMTVETAFILNEIFEPFDGVTKEEYDDYIKTYLFHDDESYDRFTDMCANNRVIDMRCLSEGETELEEAVYAILHGEMSPTQGIGSISDAMQAYIDASPYNH